MKKCCRCQETKNDVEFRKDSSRIDGLHVACKTCLKKRDKELYDSTHSTKAKQRALQKREENKLILEQYKENLACECCGEKHSSCLDFHHRDPSQKEFGIANGLSRKWSKIEEEIKKCICVCANCHRKIHAGAIVLPY